MKTKPKITNEREAARALFPIAHNDRECVYVLHLNSANNVIKKELISIGTLNTSFCHPREVFKNAILSSAKSIIIAHNHPSGNIEPSSEDRLLYERLRESGELLNIPVLDYIIVNEEQEVYSVKGES